MICTRVHVRLRYTAFFRVDCTAFSSVSVGLGIVKIKGVSFIEYLGIVNSMEIKDGAIQNRNT